jgi:hypothetical protein
MRVRIAALTALTVGLGLLGTAVAQASPDPSGPPVAAPSQAMPGMPGMDMPGMNTPAPAAPASTKLSLSAAMARAKSRPVFLQAALAGANEVPVAGGPAVNDPDGRATGLVRVQGDRITFAFSWKGTTAPTLGHIHQGRAGVNGPVVVPLFTTPMPDTVTAAAGNVTITDAALADSLRSDPDQFYLNLHTTEFPGGAVRGQLSPLRRPVDLLDLLKDGGEKAFMTGRQEVPVQGGPAVNDPDARAVSFIRPQGNSVGFTFEYLGVAPTLGHVHKAPVGQNGPVVVPLLTTPVPAGVFAVSGAVTDLDPSLVHDIAAHPRDFYTNLHSAEFPGGAARGQLFGRA